MGKSFFDLYEPPKTVVQTITNITVPTEVHQEPDPVQETEVEEINESEEK